MLSIGVHITSSGFLGFQGIVEMFLLGYC